MLPNALSHSAGSNDAGVIAPALVDPLDEPRHRDVRFDFGQRDLAVFVFVDRARSEKGTGSPTASQTKARSCQMTGTEIGLFVTPSIHHKRLPVAGVVADDFERPGDDQALRSVEPPDRRRESNSPR